MDPRVGVVAERLEQRERCVCMLDCRRGINLGDAVAESALDGGASFDAARLAESRFEEFDRGRRMLGVAHELAETSEGSGL